MVEWEPPLRRRRTVAQLSQRSCRRRWSTPVSHRGSPSTPAGTRELTGDRGLKRVGHISGAAGWVVRLDSPALLGCLGDVGMPTDRNRRQAHQRPLVAAPGWCRRRRRPPNQRARQPPGPV